MTTSTVAPSSANGQHGWYVTAPSVTLASLPSGIPATTYFRWDSSALATYTAPVTVPADGVHTLNFYSVDQADPLNRDAATGTLTFKLDSVPPGPSTSIDAHALDTTSVAVGWSVGSDAGSGIDHYTLYVDSVQWGNVSTTSTVVTGLVPNSLHTLSVVAVDAAGNVSIGNPSTTAASAALGPLATTAAVTPTVPDGGDGWYVTTPTVSFSVAPVLPAWTFYSWDGSALSTATGPITVPSNGTHTLSYWSVDQANQHAHEATQQVTFKMDASPNVRGAANAPVSIVATDSLVTDSTVNLVWSPALAFRQRLGPLRDMG